MVVVVIIVCCGWGMSFVIGIMRMNRMVDGFDGMYVVGGG